jgi:hypothetical protein
MSRSIPSDQFELYLPSRLGENEAKLEGTMPSLFPILQAGLGVSMQSGRRRQTSKKCIELHKRTSLMVQSTISIKQKQSQAVKTRHRTFKTAFKL